jgi:glycosyltransferase involved in cell wall biosynthesis
MVELAEELSQRSHQVTVMTTMPEYNLTLDDRNIKLREFIAGAGIDVIRIKTLPHHNVNYIIRGISQLVMPLQFIHKFIKYRLDIDAVIIYSPPLPLGLFGLYLRVRGAYTILNLQDLFPQNAIDLGILKNKLLIRFYRWIENLIYKNVSAITVHSIGNKLAVEHCYPKIQKNKVHVLNNWTSIEDFSSGPNAHDVDYRLKWKIKQKYIALFAGVMGPSQNLELVLKIAKHFTGDSRVVFLMVGDGIEKKKLENYAHQENLDNVIFQNFISRESYPSLLRACSIGLVSLSPENKTPVVPGKILGYMASKMPIAAFLHAKSDGHAVILESGSGVTANSDDIDSCITQMTDLLSRAEDFHIMGEKGFEYAKKHFSKDKCISQLEEMLLKSLDIANS